MVNRNAARHLLFVVSILLCFFIYMGYRLMGPKTGDGESDPETPVVTATSFTPEADDIASSDVSMPITTPLRPIETPADLEPLPSVIQGDDDFSGWIPSAAADNPALAATPSETPSLIPPGLTPPASSFPPSSGGAITGLIPAPPQELSSGGQSVEPDSFPSGMPALPIPGSQSGSAAEMALEEFDSSEPPAFLPPPVSALKPPGSGSPPPDDYSSGAGDDIPSDYVPSLPGVVSLPPPSDYEIANVTPLPEETPMRPIAPYSPPPASGNVPVPSAASLAPPAPQLNTRPPPPELAPPVPATAPVTPPSAVRPGGDLPAAVANGRNQDASESLRIYVVRPGDTLSSIASNELGSVSLADNIFLLNRDVIADPDHLLVGIKIRLPIRDDHFGQGDGGYNSPAAGIGRRPTYGIGRTHTVARGETLSSIAQRYYGSSSAWRFLYEANKTIVPNPNTLSVGAELSIPPYEN